MNKTCKQILHQFQCDFNRDIEEMFAQTLTENENVRLFFINENEAFTDGKNIVVDPAIGEVFADSNALRQAEDFLRLEHAISEDPWYALRMLTRAQNIHECLHILYSNFPNNIKTDSRSTTTARLKTLALINNIVEDAFIEAAGCSAFDNLELHLMFERLAVLFSNTPPEGTIDRAFHSEAENPQSIELHPLISYLNYMCGFLLYPMICLSEPAVDIRDYVKNTKQLFLEGSACGNPGDRYSFVTQIFDVIEPLIPESESLIDDTILKKMLTGSKTHSDNASSITNVKSRGKTIKITRRLFTSLDGMPISIEISPDNFFAIIRNYKKEKEATLEVILTLPSVTHRNGTDFDCSVIHKDIEIIETALKPNLHLRKAYQNIYNRYRLNINSYNNRFSLLLKARIPTREERLLFGTGITSQHLSDVNKRYWHRRTEDFGIPDLAILLLIDGSGSMEGARRESAMISSVILHEILKKQGMTHAIVEHRANFNSPSMDANIMVGFDSRNEEKYNLMSLSAGGENRDGLSLYWAERYLATNTNNSERLIIVIADGYPAHGYDNYYPPVSSKDTANAAARIIKRGTNIIAVALDDERDGGYACYDALKEIYPSVVSCSELKQLTGQLLNIISRHLQ